MKRILAFILCLVMFLSVTACSKKEEVNNEQDEYKVQTIQLDAALYENVIDKLSKKELDAIPIANSSMSEAKLRQLCVDFYRYTQTYAWTPDEEYTYTVTDTSKDVTLVPGTIYGGLPYVSKASGNVYRMLEFYDQETGVVDISKAGENRKLFGNQCSISTYWAWGRVCNSSAHDWSENMTQKNGFIKLGPYEYDSNLSSYKITSTETIRKNNGEQVMYESYALLKLADGLVRYTTAGHVIMVSSNATVVRNSDGTIDGSKSYVTMIDQTNSKKWHEAKQSDGTAYVIQGNIDAKLTFTELYNTNYLPFTLAELIGEDDVEKSKTTFSHSGKKISLNNLCYATVTSNYGISDIFAIIKDKNGNEVAKFPVRATKAGLKSLSFSGAISETDLQDYTDGKHKVVIKAQISTGEKPVVYTGTLTK